MEKKSIWILFVLSILFHTACQSISNERSQQISDVKLPDLFHDYIDTTNHKSETTEMINDIIPIIVTVFFLFKCLTTQHTFAFYSFLLAISVMYFIRAILFVSTTLPDPSGKCDPNGKFGTCSDLIFSGHVGLTFITFLFLGKYFYPGFNFAILSSAILTVMIFTILLNNNHYTVDILLALIIPFFIYVWAGSVSIGGEMDLGFYPSIRLCEL